MKDIFCMIMLVFACCAWCKGVQLFFLIFNHILVVFALFSLTMHLIIRNDRNLVADHNFDHNYYRWVFTNPMHLIQCMHFNKLLLILNCNFQLSIYSFVLEFHSGQSQWINRTWLHFRMATCNHQWSHSIMYHPIH